MCVCASASPVSLTTEQRCLTCVSHAYPRSLHLTLSGKRVTHALRKDANQGEDEREPLEQQQQREREGEAVVRLLSFRKSCPESRERISVAG